MKKLHRKFWFVILLICICLVALYLYNNIKTDTVTISPITRADWKTYTNKKYGFEFQYPADSIMYSDITAKGKVIPPTDNLSCISEGMVLPYTDKFETANDDPELFCVEVFPNTTNEGWLTEHGEGPDAPLNHPMEEVSVVGASRALYDHDFSRVIMQKGSDVIVFGGTYFYDGEASFGKKSPEHFSEQAFATFKIK